jgi:cold shock CspA family protein
MATGKVLQFDVGRGFGFVAADDGGEDIFLHASVFDGDTSDLVPGVPLEFQVMAGDRGRKAFAARFSAEYVPMTYEATHAHAAALAAVAAAAAKGTASTASAASGMDAADEEQMCDVLSRAEFGSELTELLLRTIPALTGAQVLEVRQGMLRCAEKHGWVDA